MSVSSAATAPAPASARSGWPTYCSPARCETRRDGTGLNIFAARFLIRRWQLFGGGHFNRVHLREVARPPVANAGDDGTDAFARARQPIFHLGRNDAVILAVDQALLGERLQFAAEHAGRDFRTAVRTAQQAGSDLAIALGAILQIPDDPQLVFAADHFLERRHRTPARQR